VTLDRQLAGVALAKIEAEVGPLYLAASRDGLDGEVLVGPGYASVGSLPATPLTDVAELWAAPLNKIYIQHPTLTDDELAEAASKSAGGFVTVAMAGEGIVELLPLGLSKATGLSLAARRLRLKSTDTIAFGDMPNDLPMLAWAGTSYGVANAHAEVLSVVDVVCPANDEDGVAAVLEELFQPLN